MKRGDLVLPVQAALNPNNIVPVAVCCFVGTMCLVLFWRVSRSAMREDLRQARLARYTKDGTFQVPVALTRAPKGVRVDNSKGLASDVADIGAVCVTTSSLMSANGAADVDDGGSSGSGWLSTRQRSRVAPKPSGQPSAPAQPAGSAQFRLGWTQWMSQRLEHEELTVAAPATTRQVGGSAFASAVTVGARRCVWR